MNEITFIILQVIVGFIVACVVYLIYINVLNIKALATESNIADTKLQVNIVSGVLSSNESAPNSEKNLFNTTVPFMKNYLPITPSVNFKGGTQFSYSFWIHIKQPEKAKNKTLFLKGDKKPYMYKATNQNFEPLSGKYKDGISKIETKRVVMCPSVMFGEEPMDFEIMFNTFNKMHEKVVIKKNDDSNSLKRNNLMSIFQSKWVNITITFQDNSAINDYENGIIVRFYVNGIMYNMSHVPGILKENRGNFYLFPDGSIADCKIADLRYYNFALSDNEVQNIARQPLNNTQAVEANESNENKSDDSRYMVLQNQLDMYNT